jgi:hypothetical protein
MTGAEIGTAIETATMTGIGIGIGIGATPVPDSSRGPSSRRDPGPEAGGYSLKS